MPILMRMATQFAGTEQSLVASRPLLNGILPYCVSFEEPWRAQEVGDDFNGDRYHAELRAQDRRIRRFDLFYKYVPSLIFVTQICAVSSLDIPQKLIKWALQLSLVILREIRGDTYWLERSKCQIRIEPHWSGNKVVRINQTDRVSLIKQYKKTPRGISRDKHGLTDAEYKKITKEIFNPLRECREFMVPEMAKYFSRRAFLRKHNRTPCSVPSLVYPGKMGKSKALISGWTSDAISDGVIYVEEEDIPLREERLEEEYWNRTR